MSKFIAPDYGQQFLFPPALEDWVPKDHPARFLREFVDQLNLSKIGFVIPAAKEGRPPYAPSLLLKIWLFGYFHRIRATRKLEAACRENLSLLWLAGLIQPDHNSLWRFWNQNQQALREVFKQTVRLAVDTGAVGLALQALDGTKSKPLAVGPRAGAKSICKSCWPSWTRPPRKSKTKFCRKIRAIKMLPAIGCRKVWPNGRALRQEIKKGLAKLAEDGRQHYHPAEPEAHRMKVGDTNRYGYNAQAVADAQEGIIVACAASNQENDVGQLAPMIEEAERNVGPVTAKPLTVADTGYGYGTDLEAARAAGATILVPPAQGKADLENPYSSPHFVYDPRENSVTCPKGRLLDPAGRKIKNGQIVQRFRCYHKDCPVRDLCTKERQGRQIEIRSYTALVQAMRARLQEPDAKALYQKRSEVIERRFAQVKQHDGFRRWTMWGLENVRTQWAVLCATLNLRVLYQRWRRRLAPAMALQQLT